MNKTVVITGSSGGIGSALVEVFSQEDWQVIGIDKSPPKQDIKFYRGDLADIEWLEKVAEKIKSSYAQVDCFIHSGVCQVEEKLETLSTADWEDMFAVNVRAGWLLARELKECMKTGSSVINISSVHGQVTSEGLGGYAATKGALNALTRAMALEWVSDGIRVNAVVPGAVETALLEKGLSRADDKRKAKENLIEATPLKRIGKPREIARLCYFLADDEGAANITGQTFTSDGGVSVQLASETGIDNKETEE